ncbi:hypothetical protein DID74_00055 [Candidatus Marinamargulisbacteria bacterium SCGC AG-333-B06]|nr:hypothetical protein DID74_00055 [Candidatus Marinamargulisbacteria bacterium SCGC AG-333-B06]
MKIIILLLILISSQISGKNIFQNLNNTDIMLIAGKSYQTETSIGSSTFTSNFQNTFGIQLPINNTLYLGCNIDFFSLIPKQSSSQREYKVRSITPSITQKKRSKYKFNHFYGLKIPIQMISYKESGTIDKNDDQLTSIGIEPLIGGSINLYKTISLQLEVSTCISYLPKLSHVTTPSPKSNIAYLLPKFSLLIIF